MEDRTAPHIHSAETAVRQPRASRVRTARALLLTGLVLMLVVAGCGGGSSAARERRINNPVRPESVNARVKHIRMLHIRIQRPNGVHAAGAAAGLFLTITNDSSKHDTLTAVSSVDAERVVFRDGSAPPGRISVPVHGHDTVSLQHATGPHLEMIGLKRDLPKRHFVPVTFRFAQAGAVTVQVFVQGVDHAVVPPSA